MAAKLLIEKMAVDDLPQVMTIEQETLSPWSLPQLEAELQQTGGWQFVARRSAGEQIAGYVCGRSVAGEAEIFKIAVAAAQRCQGIASVLLEHALQFLAGTGVTKCYLELRASNVAAKHLYEKYGFKETAVRKKYYSDPQEDAAVMVKSLMKEEGVR